MFYDYLETPIGRLLLAADAEGLRHVDFATSKYPTSLGVDWQRDAAPLQPVAEQLNAYFSGELKNFSLTLSPRGTPFQLGVWQTLGAIPYGTTISYGELAHRIGNPKASRAVGAANGRNPIPIIVPCHRVIGNDGSLTGFGGAIDTKRNLIALEQNRSGLFA